MQDAESPRQAKIHRVLERSATYLTTDFWEHLFHPLREMLIARVRRLLPKLPLEDSEDIADETILRLYRYYDIEALEQCSSEEQRRKSFYSFVGRTLYCAISDLLRQKGLVKSDSGSPNGQDNDSPKTSPVPPVPLERISEAFQTLKPDAQQLLRYKIIDGMTYKEIQQQYAQHGKELSSDALKMRTLRALAELRRALNEGTRGS